MEKRKVFCMACKQKLETTFLGKVLGFEFEDGFYCTTCGKAKVKKIRDQL